MGLFTDVAAALSYNFGGEDLDKTQPEFVKNVFEKYNDKLSLSSFLYEKHGIFAGCVEDYIEQIIEFGGNFDNIPYDEIYQKYGACKSSLDNAANSYKEYEKWCTEQNYHVNENYEDVTRANETIKEVEAIQDIRNLLDFLEKRIKGELDEQGKRSMEENAERWKADIVILRNYIEQQIE